MLIRFRPTNLLRLNHELHPPPNEDTHTVFPKHLYFAFSRCIKTAAFHVIFHHLHLSLPLSTIFFQHTHTYASPFIFIQSHVTQLKSIQSGLDSHELNTGSMVDLFHRAWLFLVSGGEKKRESVCFECMCHRVKNNSFVNAQRLACPLQETKHDNINITHLSHYLTLLAFLQECCMMVFLPTLNISWTFSMAGNCSLPKGAAGLQLHLVHLIVHYITD